MRIKTYSELIALPTYIERFRYLQLRGVVGQETFGFDRIINQFLYQRSQRWKQIRRDVIVRDHGCDMAMDGYEIQGRILVHHMNPITLEDIEKESDFVFDPEYLISVAHNTHNAIHYGDESLLVTDPIVRMRNDTCPWRK